MQSEEQKKNRGGLGTRLVQCISQIMNMHVHNHAYVHIPQIRVPHWQMHLSM